MRAILRHLALSLLVATVVPTLLFYVCLLLSNVRVALNIALAWCYAAVAWRLTLLWSVICGVKAAATLWMLHAMSLHTFVAAKAVFTPRVATLGATVTAVLAVRVARREGLLPATSGASGLSFSG